MQTAQPRAPARGNKASNLWLKMPVVVGAAAGETPSLTGEVVGQTHRGLGRAQAHLLFYVIIWRGKEKWIKTAGVYSMLFKLPSPKEGIGDPLDMYSVNRDILPN